MYVLELMMLYSGVCMEKKDRELFILLERSRISTLLPAECEINTLKIHSFLVLVMPTVK